MKRNTFDYHRDGLPAIGCEEAYAFGQERYDDFLREAEHYRLGQRVAQSHPPVSRQPTQRMSKSPLAHLLIWARALWAN
jgi:hypothetical protein